MSDPTEQRKLAAIMFTDMVGYSALSQRDDKLALELLEEHRRLLREIFPRFHGTEIKTIGDAFLVEFNSALEAAQCAIEIQRALAKHNADVPPDRRIEVKIGIHIGDVVHRGGDVYGDGVNIASRIEPLAGAGGICVSMDVERQIRNAVETRFEKLAPTELKNISVPMELFRIVLPWERQPKAEEGRKNEETARSSTTKWIWAAAAALILLLSTCIAWWWTTLPHTNPASATKEISKPQNVPEKSIAVLPFENLSDDKANAYFAEGIQDEILTRLSKIAALKVISRTSTQKYKSAPDNLREVGQQLGVANLLEGSVQKAADAVHINVQLIKAATDEHLWAESYDRELKNIFGVEGEVASAIAEALRATLTGAEKKALAAQPTQNLDAYAAYLRALSIEQTQWSYAGWEKAAAAYTEAVQLDPTFALAWARLAGVQSLLYLNGSNITKNTAASVKEPADRAMALQPELGESWVAQGDYRYRVLRDFTGGLQAYDEARKRLPNSSLVFLEMASVERRLGRWQEVEDHLRKAAEIDPRNIQIFETLGQFFPLLRRFDEAQTAFDHALEISPNEEDVFARKAEIFQREGRLDEAGRELAKVPGSSTNEVVANVRIGQVIYERRFDDGIALSREILSRIKPGEPLDTFAKVFLVQLANLEQWAGRSSEAQKAFSQALQAIKPTPETIVAADGAGMPNYLAEVYAGLGNKEEALAQAHRSVAQYSDDAVRRPDAEETLAQIEARFGDLDSALAALPDLLKVPAGITAAELRLDPRWDPLRKDPRFQKLCQEK